MNHDKSTAAFEEARKYIPGGVNSPVRSFRSVPRFHVNITYQTQSNS